jgi:hypothetical protein
VDGGYYENSGTTTVFELLRAMRAAAPQAWEQIIPVVVMISNDPDLDQTWDTLQTRPKSFGSELLSPFRALMKTREARGAFSRSLARDLVVREQGGMFIWMRLWPSFKPTPSLGWTLSPTAKDVMTMQLLSALGSLQEERDRVEPRTNVFPTVDKNLPDCLRPHVPMQSIDVTCSVDPTVTHRVLQFLLGSSDFRDALPTREECEQTFRDLLPTLPEKDRKHFTPAIIEGLCSPLRERGQ